MVDILIYQIGPVKMPPYKRTDDVCTLRYVVYRLEALYTLCKIHALYGVASETIIYNLRIHIGMHNMVLLLKPLFTIYEYKHDNKVLNKQNETPAKMQLLHWYFQFIFL